MAIVTNKPIPPICFIHVENLKTGGIIMTPPKVSQSVRPPTHHEVSESKRAKRALTPAGKWLESHHVTTSSSSAGGNLTATNATASDNGIVQVDIEAEETSPEAYQAQNQLQHTIQQISFQTAKMLTYWRNLTRGEDNSY